MSTFLNFITNPIVLTIIIIWEAIWKGIGLWSTASKRKTAWFVCIFIFNTIGILPIIYLAFFNKDKKKVKKKK